MPALLGDPQARNDYNRALAPPSPSMIERMAECERRIARYEHDIAEPDWMFGGRAEQERVRLIRLREADEEWLVEMIRKATSAL